MSDRSGGVLGSSSCLFRFGRTRLGRGDDSFKAIDKSIHCASRIIGGHIYCALFTIWFFHRGSVGEKQLVFNAKDITRFQMRCDKCKSDVTFNGEAVVGPSDAVRCPNCDGLMAGVASIAHAYRTFLRVLKETDRQTQFVVTLRE